MSYKEKERKKAVNLRSKLFRDPGGGVFFGIKRPFVLKNPKLNLWAGIRQDAISYFNDNRISWWKGEKSNDPTGHLLSSQIACINHLFFARQRDDVASAILRTVSTDITRAIKVDKGYVEFEAVGKDNYLGEKLHTRGANSTSIDAVMVGRKKSGRRVLVLIEWKYTESYSVEDKYIKERWSIYDKLISAPDSPIKVQNPKALYYEPFYQLMRQALLGWKMVSAKEYGCEEFIHVHVIPEQNRKLRSGVTSPGLNGKDISTAWKSVLKVPSQYKVFSPRAIIAPVRGCLDTETIVAYLEERYWNQEI